MVTTSGLGLSPFCCDDASQNILSFEAAEKSSEKMTQKNSLCTGFINAASNLRYNFFVIPTRLFETCEPWSFLEDQNNSMSNIYCAPYLHQYSFRWNIWIIDLSHRKIFCVTSIIHIAGWLLEAIRILLLRTASGCSYNLKLLYRGRI